MGLIESQTGSPLLGTANVVTNLLRLQDVTKTYVTDGQQVPALGGVSLTVCMANSLPWSDAVDAASQPC